MDMESKTLASLPSEVLLRILLLLPAPALVAISKTSTFFHTLFTQSSLLQYTHALQEEHLLDNLSNQLVSSADKLKFLRERSAAWRSHKWAKRQAFVVEGGDSGTLYDFLGGVLGIALEAPARTMRFYKIPSTLGSSDVPHREFTPGWIIKDFTMDAAQDLLVLIQIYSPAIGGRPLLPRRYCFRLHFFNLTSFAPHPLANEHVLTWPYTVSDSRAAPYISVMDGLVSLHAKAHDDTRTEGGFCIWDWRSGTMVSAQPSAKEEVIESFAFLGPKEFLVAAYDVEGEQAMINLYAFDPDHKPPTNDANPVAPRPKLVAEFFLPALLHRPDAFSLRLDPAPGVEGPCVPPFAEGDEAARGVMFFCDEAERLIVVDLQFLVPDPVEQWMGIEKRFTFFVLKSTFMRAFKHQQAAAAAEPSSPLSTEGEDPKSSLLDEIVDSEDDEAVTIGEDDNDDDWVDAPETMLKDGAIAYPWDDWKDRARLISGIPLPHGWVLYVYHLKFVHPITYPVIPESNMHLGIRQYDCAARVLDFSPRSVDRIRRSDAKAGVTPQSFTTSPSIIFPDRPLPEVPISSREDGDIGRVISLPTKVTSEGIWEDDEIVTGRELPYIEREMPIFMRETTGEGQGPGSRERLNGVCIDEQRLVWVKRSTSNRNLILDIHLF